MRLGVEAALVDRRLVPGDVEVEDGTVTAVGLGGGGRGIAAPRLRRPAGQRLRRRRLHAPDRDGYVRAGEAMLAAGTTAYQPTFITAPEADLVAALRAMPAGRRAAGRM